MTGAFANRKVIRNGLRSARMLLEYWHGLALDSHRGLDGEVRMDAEARYDLAPFDRTFAWLAEASEALDMRTPTGDKRVIRDGLRAGPALARGYREAITNGYGDAEEEPERHIPECARYVAPVDRAVAKLQAAMDATETLPPASGGIEGAARPDRRRRADERRALCGGRPV
jgi:hypothetical protein